MGDSDGTGFITPKELKIGLRALTLEMPEAVESDILNRFASDGDKMNIHDFSRLLDAQLATVYAHFLSHKDSDPARGISISDLRRISRDLQKDSSQADLEQMVSLIQPNMEGKIGQEEFKQLLLMPPGVVSRPRTTRPSIRKSLSPTGTRSEESREESRNMARYRARSVGTLGKLHDYGED